MQVHLHVFYWLWFSVPIIENIDITDYGWRINEEEKVVPVWFTGPQLHPKIDKKYNVKNVKGDALEPPTKILCLHTMTEESDDLGEGNSVVTEDLETINYTWNWGFRWCYICFGNDTSSEDEYVSDSDYEDEYVSDSDYEDEYVSDSDYEDEYVSDSDYEDEYVSDSDYEDEYVSDSDYEDEYVSDSDYEDGYVSHSDYEDEYVSHSDYEDECVSHSDYEDEYVSDSDYEDEYVSDSDYEDYLLVKFFILS